MMTMNLQGPEPLESEPESICTSGVPAMDSAIVVTLPDAAMEHGELVELISGAVSASHLLGLPELLLYASAVQLPGLAVAAAEVSEIPEGFQLRQIDAESGELSDLPANATQLSVDSLLGLDRACQAA
ncbi:hypothetical protein COCCU_00885 [Corynebacterium occultum]|uniref:Uncharacterized protein n=1 Tax=Corynebacterium occultum TaxID=2675219 RepID=A0A6B8W408_9CORY|nr:hypothetical protein [Corynebacterium occultum]QGU06145.1 hypothetical protein COCCU_00885 [Corynebacterium occultum]